MCVQCEGQEWLAVKSVGGNGSVSALQESHGVPWGRFHLLLPQEQRRGSRHIESSPGKQACWVLGVCRSHQPTSHPACSPSSQMSVNSASTVALGQALPFTSQPGREKSRVEICTVVWFMNVIEVESIRRNWEV